LKLRATDVKRIIAQALTSGHSDGYRLRVIALECSAGLLTRRQAILKYNVKASSLNSAIESLDAEIRRFQKAFTVEQAANSANEIRAENDSEKVLPLQNCAILIAR